MGDAPPAVSVVIPTYDRLPLLRQAVASVAAQTFGDWELLVVDDGSGDATLAYLSSLPDARIRPLPVPHGGNVARARNVGVRAAVGRYVAFLDSDDVWLPGKLEAQLERMARAGAAWSYTRYEHMDAEGRPVAARAGVWRPLSGRIAREVLAGGASIAISTVVAERRLLTELGGFDEDPGIHLREDFDLVARLALAAEVVALAEPLSRVRDHDGRATRACADPFARTVRVYDKLLATLPAGELRDAARHRRAHHLADAAAHHLAARSGAEAVACLRGALRGGVGYGDWLAAVGRGLRGAAHRRARQVVS